MKRPAGHGSVRKAQATLKKPAQVKGLPPCLKRPSAWREEEAPKKFKREEEKQEKVEEDPEEENPVSDPVVEPEKHQKKLTKKALQDHNQFVSEVSKMNPSLEEFEKMIGQSDKGMVMRLWEHFEGSRKATGEDSTFKDLTTGAGSLTKKKELLRSWVLDGGKPAKHYKIACQELAAVKGIVGLASPVKGSCCDWFCGVG